MLDVLLQQKCPSTELKDMLNGTCIALAAARVELTGTQEHLEQQLANAVAQAAAQEQDLGAQVAALQRQMKLVEKEREDLQKKLSWEKSRSEGVKQSSAALMETNSELKAQLFKEQEKMRRLEERIAKKLPLGALLGGSAEKKPIKKWPVVAPCAGTVHDSRFLREQQVKPGGGSTLSRTNSCCSEPNSCASSTAASRPGTALSDYSPRVGEYSPRMEEPSPRDSEYSPRMEDPSPRGLDSARSTRSVTSAAGQQQEGMVEGGFGARGGVASPSPRSPRGSVSAASIAGSSASFEGSLASTPRSEAGGDVGEYKKSRLSSDQCVAAAAGGEVEQGLQAKEVGECVGGHQQQQQLQQQKGSAAESVGSESSGVEQVSPSKRAGRRRGGRRGGRRGDGDAANGADNDMEVRSSDQWVGPPVPALNLAAALPVRGRRQGDGEEESPHLSGASGRRSSGRSSRKAATAAGAGEGGCAAADGGLAAPDGVEVAGAVGEVAEVTPLEGICGGNSGEQQEEKEGKGEEGAELAEEQLQEKVEERQQEQQEQLDVAQGGAEIFDESCSSPRVVQQAVEDSEVVDGQSSCCCNIGSPVQAGSSPVASSSTVQQPSPLSGEVSSDICGPAAAVDGDGDAGVDSSRSSGGSRALLPPSCASSSPAREMGSRPPRGMVRASSDGAIPTTTSSFSFALGISAAAGSAADVSCDLTLGFGEGGTPSTATGGGGGGSTDGRRRQQQQEFFTPMRQPQLQLADQEEDVWETPLTSFSPRPGHPAGGSGGSGGGAVRPGEWSPSSSLIGSSISPAAAGAGWPHRRSRSSIAAVDLRPLALSPVPDGSDGGVGAEDEDEVGVDGSSGGGSGSTSRSSNGEEEGEAGAAVGLGNEDSRASIVGLPGVGMEEGLGAAASSGAAAAGGDGGHGVADGISSCDSSIGEALSGLTGEESLGNLVGEESVNGGLGFGATGSGSLGEEGVVLWSGGAGRWKGAEDAAALSRSGTPESKAPTTAGEVGADGQGLHVVPEVPLPVPLVGVSPRVVPKDRYQQQHRYGKQPTPPPTLPQLQQALHHKSPRQQQLLRYSGELPLLQQGGLGGNPAAVGGPGRVGGGSLVGEGPLAAAAGALPRAAAGAVRPLSAQGHHRGKATTAAARCSNDSSSSMSSTESSCDEAGGGVVVEVKEAGPRGGLIKAGGGASPAGGRKDFGGEGLEEVVAAAQQQQGPLSQGLRGLGRLATGGGANSSTSPAARGPAAGGPQAFALMLDDPQEVCSPVRGFRTGGSFSSLVGGEEGSAVNRSLSSLTGVRGLGGAGQGQQLASSSLSSLSPLRAAIGGSPVRSSGGGGSSDGGMRGSQRGSPMRWSQKWGTQG